MAEQTPSLPAPMARRLARAEAHARDVYLDYGSRLLARAFMALGAILAAIVGLGAGSAVQPEQWLLAGLVMMGVTGLLAFPLGYSMDPMRDWLRGYLERGAR